VWGGGDVGGGFLLSLSPNRCEGGKRSTGRPLPSDKRRRRKRQEVFFRGKALFSAERGRSYLGKKGKKGRRDLYHRGVGCTRSSVPPQKPPPPPPHGGKEKKRADPPHLLIESLKRKKEGGARALKPGNTLLFPPKIRGVVVPQTGGGKEREHHAPDVEDKRKEGKRSYGTKTITPWKTVSSLLRSEGEKGGSIR